MIDPELILSDEEFGALSPAQQDEYLRLVQAELDHWGLQPKQQFAEDTANQADETLFGGAAGPGKSEWLLWHADRWSRDIPGHRTLMLRSSFPELRRSLITRSLLRISPDTARYKVGDKEWHYKNGSVIEFGYCETDEDVRQYLSAEYDLVCFDELTEFSEYQYKMIRSRLRTTRRKARLGCKPHAAGATNPGQRGHSWVKQRFVINTNYGEKIAEVPVDEASDEPDLSLGVRRVAFVPALVTDNAFIDPNYVRELQSLPATERQQYLFGDWDTFAGMYFSEWRRDVHVVEPFAIPESWPRVRAIDYGYAKPACCLWLAFDEDGNCYVYREFYETKRLPSEQARIIIDRSVLVDEQGRRRPERIRATLADPSIWNKTGVGDAVAAQYRAEGLLCKKAMNARVDGWAMVREYLKVDPATKQAKLRIFSTCRDLIRTLPDMIYDKDVPEDLDTDLEDHAVDALRYGLAKRGGRARAPKHEAPDTLEERMARHLDGMVRDRERPRHDVLGAGV